MTKMHLHRPMGCGKSDNYSVRPLHILADCWIIFTYLLTYCRVSGNAAAFSTFPGVASLHKVWSKLKFTDTSNGNVDVMKSRPSQTNRHGHGVINKVWAQCDKPATVELSWQHVTVDLSWLKNQRSREKYQHFWRYPNSLIHRVKWRHISMVAIRSPFCRSRPSYCA